MIYYIKFQNNDGVLLTISIIYLFDIFYKGSTAFLLLLFELFAVLFIDLLIIVFYLVGVVSVRFLIGVGDVDLPILGVYYYIGDLDLSGVVPF